MEIQPGVDGGPPTTLYFYNNTIYGCGWKGANGPSATGNICFDRLNTYKLVFTNNIIVSTGQPYEARAEGNFRPAPGTICGSGARSGASVGYRGAINIDPQFVNPQPFDFHLHRRHPNSPAIGKGFDIRAIAPRDFDNIIRPLAPSLGVFEFVIHRLNEP